jgi:hypothetical protein
MRRLVALGSFVVLAAAAGAALHAEEAKKPAKGVASMGWLAGDWTSDEHGMAFDEHWLAPKGDSMFAVSRMVQGTATKMCELSVIEETEDGTWLRVRHFSRSLEPWKMDAAGPMAHRLVESAENRAVFEDGKREFPRRIVYSREGDVLTARLEGTKGGKPADQEFKLTLAKR